MAGTIKTEFLVVAGVALALIYLTQRAAGAIADTAGQLWDAAKEDTKYINPFDGQNLINQGFEGMYRAVTGSTANPGSDFYDYMHKGDPIPGAVRDPETGLIPAYNYTVEQQAADLKATRQLEAGFHGM